MKKRITVLVLIVLWLGGCWLIGKQKNIQKSSENVQENISQNILENDKNNSIGENNKFENICFEGNRETTDNPWNMTAGIFEMEEEGNCILLTPNTAVQFEELRDRKSFSFCCEIHPWVQESSDGAGLIIWIMGREDIILYEEEILIDSEESWKTIELDLSLYHETEKIKLLCNNGGNGDDSGDWVVVKLLEAKGDANTLENELNKDITLNEEKDKNVQNGKQQEEFTLFSADQMPKYGGISGQVNVQIGGVSPVLSVGEGEWDSIDVLNPSVILRDGIYYNYYSGWDGTTWRTGLADSVDGVNWKKYSKNPVLDIRKENWDDSYIAANGSAICFQNKIYYFYQGITEGTRKAKIGLAISENGKDFKERTKDAVLSVGESGTWDCAGVADPYVIEVNGILYLYYLGQDRLGVQRLGVAKSVDGKEWVKYINNPIMDVGVRGAFDEGGLGEPSVIYQAPYFYMLYTGRDLKEQRNLGVAVSLDGVNWKKLNYRGMIEVEEGQWNSKVICDTTLMETENGEVLVWYGGGNTASPDQNLNGRIGMFQIAFDKIEDSDQFDVKDNWEKSLVGSTDFLKGSYEIEGEGEEPYAWCSDNAAIVLEQKEDAEKIIVSGYLPMDLYQRIGEDEVKLSFYLNGELAEEKTFQTAEVFEIEIEQFDEMKKGRYLELQIKASLCINPKEYQISEDERDLSWMVKRIWQE